MKRLKTILFLCVCTVYSVYGVLNEKDKKELLEKFAPHVYFHSRERCFPGNIETFVLLAALKDKNDKEVLEKENLTLAALKKLPENYNNEDYSISLNASSVYRHGERPKKNTIQAPCYSHIIEKKDGRAVIQYMFFYPYNGSRIFETCALLGAHEGDWEHIDVHLKSTSEKKYILDKIFYAQHDHCKGNYVDVSQVYLENETHPVVYAARGSHASFSRPGFHLSYGDFTSNNGVRWSTEPNIIDVGTRAKPAKGQEWVTFKGHWGFHGPKTPSQQSWWRETGEQYYALKNILLSDGNESRVRIPFSLSVPKRIQKLRWTLFNEHKTEANRDMLRFEQEQDTTRIALQELGWCRNLTIFDNIQNSQITSVPSFTKRLALIGTIADKYLKGEALYMKIEGVEE